MAKKHIKDQKLLKEIAVRLKKLREQKEVTQQEVYMELDINLARIETGKHNITVSTLNTLCKYFDITLADFFKGLK